MKSISFCAWLLVGVVWGCSTFADAVIVQDVEVRMFTTSLPNDEVGQEVTEQNCDFRRTLYLADLKVKVARGGQFQTFRNDKEFMWVGMTGAVAADRWPYARIEGIKADNVKSELRMLDNYGMLRPSMAESKIPIAKDGLAWMGHLVDEVEIRTETPGEFKEILGHKCARYIIMVGDRKAYDGWLATDIPMTPEEASALASLRDMAIGEWGTLESVPRGGFPKGVISEMRELRFLPLEEQLLPWHAVVVPRVHITARELALDDIPAREFELAPNVIEVIQGDHGVFNEVFPVFE